jgi:hypothetical protein
MRIGNYRIRPDDVGWIVATIKIKGPTSKTPGEEYEADVVFPSTLAKAMHTVMDRMVKDEYPGDVELAEIAAHVEFCYADLLANIELATLEAKVREGE